MGTKDDDKIAYGDKEGIQSLLPTLHEILKHELVSVRRIVHELNKEELIPIQLRSADEYTRRMNSLVVAFYKKMDNHRQIKREEVDELIEVFKQTVESDIDELRKILAKLDISQLYWERKKKIWSLLEGWSDSRDIDDIKNAVSEIDVEIEAKKNRLD